VPCSSEVGGKRSTTSSRSHNDVFISCLGEGSCEGKREEEEEDKGKHVGGQFVAEKLCGGWEIYQVAFAKLQHHIYVAFRQVFLQHFVHCANIVNLNSANNTCEGVLVNLRHNNISVTNHKYMSYAV
jgi:hypothetical protein